MTGNVIKALIGFATVTLIANALGLAKYGQYQLLISNASALLYLIDLQASKANFTFHNQTPQPKIIDIVLYYWYALQFAIFVAILLCTPWLRLYFKIDSPIYIMLAFSAAYAQYRLFSFAAQRAETIRLTHYTQINLLWSSAAIFTTLYTLNKHEAISIPVIFAVSILIWIAAAVILFATISRKLTYITSDIDTNAVLLKYRTFVTPLIAITFLGILGETADRIILQHYTGFEQQGVLGIAKQISSFVLLASTSILMVYSREITNLTHNNKPKELKRITQYFSWFSIVFGGAISIFFLEWGKELSSILFSTEFQQTHSATVIALFISMLQGIGQLYGTSLIAASKTKVQAKISAIMISIGLFGTYIAINPSLVAGGAYELLVKQLIVQFIGIQITSLYVRRNIGYAISATHLIIAIALLYLLCTGLKQLFSMMSLSTNVIMLVNGIVYFGIIVIASFFIYKRLKCTHL